MRKLLLPIAAFGLLVTGCSSEASDVSAPAESSAVSGTSSTQPAATTNEVAKAIQAKIPQATKVVEITEENDPNNLFGRPTGYSQATMIVDKRADCDAGLGVDCGAVIELWPSEAAANKRKAYIQSILEDSPIFGSEYDTVNGPMLLRVTGNLKPSAAKAYEQAFTEQ